MDGKRYLVVTADDFGIGPDTSRGILELAAAGVVTGTVLLINAPHAEDAVRAWQQAGVDMEVGWHPCLTLDRPILPAARVPSLVGPEGIFHPLGRFLWRLWRGQVRAADVRAELRAQHARFRDLVGHAPTLVNSHHHVQVFWPVGSILRDILGSDRPRPYFRRVHEPLAALVRVPGARAKRAFLSMLGRFGARQQRADGFPGNDWLAGITDPPCVRDPQFLTRWLARMPGRVVELTCHPGHLDHTLIGRDCKPGDGQQLRRVREMHLLRDESFRHACRLAGFRLSAPRDCGATPARRLVA